MIQISSNGEIIKDISTYPKLTFTHTMYVQGFINLVNPLSLLSFFAVKACRIVSTLDFLFTALAHHLIIKLMYLYTLSEMKKGGAPLFLK